MSDDRELTTRPTHPTYFDMIQERRKFSSNRQQSLDTEYYHADSMAPQKNRQNDRQAICFLYASSVVAAGLSIAVASMNYERENEQRSLTADWGKLLFVSSLYGTSCFILLVMACYFELHRDETFEAVHRGSGPVLFSVKFSLEGEKVNLYLRLGLAMFGLMSIGHVGVKFQEDLHKEDVSAWSYLTPILEMAFFVLQTLFILRYHRLVILRYNEIMGAGLVHLLTTNLCIWADVSVGKIDKTLSYNSNKNKYKYVLANQSHGGGNNSSSTHLDLMGVSFYLLPSVSEYCLLAAALIYEITVRIGQPSFIEIEKNADEKRQSNKSIQRIRACGNSKGAWFGILTVLMVIALTILTTATPNEKKRQANFWKSIVILTEEAILCFLGIGFVLVAFMQIRKLKFSIATRQSHAEAFLLYTAFFFGANYTISTMILAADFKHFDRNPGIFIQIERYLLICRCLLNAFELIQILLQTYLIQDSFHRCSDSIPHQLTKPGRQSIVALLGINLAFWIQQSFQLKKADILFLNEDDERTYGWILSVVTMPISLFYRYHCTVCLSQCFHKLYENETRRFEEIWRYRVDPITDMIIPVMGALSMCGQFGSANGSNLQQETKQSPERLQPQPITVGTSPRRRKLAAFSRTKPWKTFDIPDESSINTRTSYSPSGREDKIEFPLLNNLITENIEEESNSHIPNGNESTRIPVFKIETVSDHSTYEADDPIETNGRGPTNNMTTEDAVNAFQISTTRIDSPIFQRYSKIIPIRRYTKSLTSPPTSLDDFISSTAIKKLSNTDKVMQSPRGSISRNPPLTQPIRRRRTLKNLETAKYRVLAAELAHRMVIERGFTRFNRSSKISGYDTIGCSSDVEYRRKLNMQTELSSFNSHDDRQSPKADYSLAQAMSETAAITIAPVESRLLSQSDCSKHSETTSFTHRIRQSLFPAFSRASLFPHLFEYDASELLSPPSSHKLKAGTWSNHKSNTPNTRASSFRNLLRPKEDVRLTGSFDSVRKSEVVDGKGK